MRASRRWNKAKGCGRGSPAATTPLFPELEKIAHDHPAILGEDAFGMELHTPDWKFFVPNAHDLAFIGFRRDFQAVRNRIALNDERMISGGGERIRHFAEKVLV